MRDGRAGIAVKTWPGGVAPRAAALATWNRLSGKQRRLSLAALLVGWIVGGGLLLWLQRGLTFGVDETAWFSTAGVAPLEHLLWPSNGHLTVLPFLLFRLTLVIFGSRVFPFAIFEVIVLCAVSLGLYVFARSRVGPVLALVPALLPIFLGSGWALLLLPMIASQWALSIACGIWAFLAVERERRSFDIAACLLLSASLASFSVGVAFLAACAILVSSGPRRLTRVWVVAVPISLYAAWWLWGAGSGGEGIHLGYLLLLPAYAVDSIAVVVAALLGHPLSYGPATSLYTNGIAPARAAETLAIAVGVSFLGWLVLRSLRRRGSRSGALAVLAIPLVLWASQAVTLGHFRTPAENRYYYAGAVALLMVAAEFLRGAKPSRLATSLLLAGSVACAVANLPRFQDGRAAQLAYSHEARAEMAMVELAGRKGDQAFDVNSQDVSRWTPNAEYLFLISGRYLDAVDRYGRVGFPPAQLVHEPDALRAAADVTLSRVYHLELLSASAAARACRTITSAGSAADVTAALPRGGAVVVSRASRAVELGRFSSRYPVDLGRLPPRRPSLIRIPLDRASPPWRISVSGGAPLAICTVGRQEATGLLGRPSVRDRFGS